MRIRGRPEPTEQSAYTRLKDLLLLTAWFGLVTGLVEGTGLLAFQQLGWLNWDIAELGVSREIVWISPLFDLFLFGTIGLLLTGLEEVFPRLRRFQLAWFLVAFLMCFDWVGLTGRLRHSGVFFLALGLAVTFYRWARGQGAMLMDFFRKSLPWVAFAVVGTLVGIQTGLWFKERRAIIELPTAAPGSPNLLVIVVDTLRADHLSTYGYARDTSPNLDRIARQGVLFENAFATSSWTLPSHASLLTGRYPHEHGAVRDYFDGRYPTLAEVLRQHGYRTAAFSANTLWFSRKRGFGHGFIRFEDYFHSVSDMVIRTFYGRKYERFVLRPLGYKNLLGRKRGEDVTHAALRWIHTDTERPFFAFLNYFDVHDPYLPPEPYRHRYSKLKSPGGILNSQHWRFYPKMTPEQLQGELDAYDGGINYVDDEIGKLLGELARSRLTADTLVIITSDHGESFGEHGLLTHINALYREVIRVPLIFLWPRHLPAGVRINQPVSIASLPATVMEMIGAGGQRVFPGPSLVELWHQPERGAGWPDPLAELAQFHYEPVKKNPCYHGEMKSLISSRWQFIQHETFGPALYDWRTDPGEMKDLIHTPEGQRVASGFAEALRNRLLQNPEPERGAACVDPTQTRTSGNIPTSLSMIRATH